MLYGRPRPGEVALLVLMPDYEDGFTPLSGDTTQGAAAEEASRSIEYWTQEIDTNNPDFRTTGSERERQTTAEDASAGPMTIYWDSFYGGDFSLVPEGWEEENIAPLHQVAAAATVSSLCWTSISQTGVSVGIC